MSASPPHFAVPFRLGLNGVVATNEQGTVDEIRANVTTILTFPLGSFDPDLDFGLPPILFETIPVNTQIITSAVQAYEPRAEDQDVEESLQTDPLTLAYSATQTVPGP